MEENILVPVLDFFLDPANVTNPQANGSNRVEGAIYGKKADLTTNYVNGVGEIAGHIGDNHVRICYNSFVNRIAFKFSLDNATPFIADKSDILLVLRDYLITPDETADDKRPDVRDPSDSEKPL